MTAALLSTFACDTKKAPGTTADEVVAVVNMKEIRGREFQKEYSSFKKRIKLGDANNEELEKKIRNGVMDTMIQRRLIKEEAEKAGITITPKMEEDAVAALLNGLPPTSMKGILEKQGQTYDEWKESVAHNLLMEKLLAIKISKMVSVTDDEVRKYYDEHPDEFKKPARARVLNILTDNADDAEKIRGSLANGADFSEMAKKYSKSPEAEQGGDLGMTEEGQMPKELDEVIFKLKENETSKVIKSAYGFQIIRVTKTEKAGITPFQDAKEKIHNRMFQERLEKRFSEWLQELRRNAKVTVYTDKLYRL
ncbi:MAG: peptidyl-prolyl cis-trans isomerase [Nitrospinae bacterium]|nr:peptidyl-prolyl cis-trans isomerase [Nitrospinota bacterium]